MKHVLAHKAHATVDEVGPAVIEIAGKLPEFTGDDWMMEAHQFYLEESLLIEDALYYSLPGGTYEALLAQMLKRRASIFRAPFEQEGSER